MIIQGNPRRKEKEIRSKDWAESSSSLQLALQLIYHVTLGKSYFKMGLTIPPLATWCKLLRKQSEFRVYKYKL